MRTPDETESEWNCSQWRSLSPSNALNASGRYTAKCIYLPSIENYLAPEVQEVVNPADVIIVQRNLIKQSVWDFCDYWRGLGKLVVADLDDAYQIMPRANPASPYWNDNRGNLPIDPVDALTEGLRHVDGLMAPSRQLLEDWKDTVPGYFLPNWATGEWYKALPQRERGDEIIIGWGGSVSHYDSWWGSGIRAALTGICAEFPHVKVKICGNDRRIYEQLPVPDGQKIFQPGVPPEKWPEQVNTFDIGVAPLSGDYDQRRSWIKALEYLLVGIPWVATAGRPYEDFVSYGSMVEQGTGNWHKALRDVVVNYDERLKAARENQAVGWGNTLESRIDDYAGIFGKIAAIRRGPLPGIKYVHWNGDQSAESDNGVAEDLASGDDDIQGRGPGESDDVRTIASDESGDGAA